LWVEKPNKVYLIAGMPYLRRVYNQAGHSSAPSFFTALIAPFPLALKTTRKRQKKKIKIIFQISKKKVKRVKRVKVNISQQPSK